MNLYTHSRFIFNSNKQFMRLWNVNTRKEEAKLLAHERHNFDAWILRPSPWTSFILFILLPLIRPQIFLFKDQIFFFSFFASARIITKDKLFQSNVYSAQQRPSYIISKARGWKFGIINSFWIFLSKATKKIVLFFIFCYFMVSHEVCHSHLK